MRDSACSPLKTSDVQAVFNYLQKREIDLIVRGEHHDTDRQQKVFFSF